jgi:hypothetical protein
MAVESVGFENVVAATPTVVPPATPSGNATCESVVAVNVDEYPPSAENVDDGR